MRVVLFCHSLLSDWNHGNAHFLRGVVSELAARAHDVRVYEPEAAWSVVNLLADHGPEPIAEVRATFPEIRPIRYRPERLDLGAALAGADVVIVHEWNDPELVRRVGEHRAKGGRFRLYFHDTHHRCVSDPGAIARLDLSAYDGVLAFGRSVADVYLEQGWARRAYVWHEAADTSIFYPRDAEGGGQSVRRGGPSRAPFRLSSRGTEHARDLHRGHFDHHQGNKDLDLVWIGNFGDGERTAELEELIVAPVRDLGLRARFHGVRYPESALAMLSRAGIGYGGFLPNHRVPQAFARARLTVHVPRRPYVESLPGIPTIRPFEALACGIPLVSGPWRDTEGLFEPGRDFLVARDRAEMIEHLRALLASPEAAAAMADRGRRTLLARHTCEHRVDELLAIVGEKDA